MIPAITSKLYQQMVTTMVGLPYTSRERARLAALQRQLAEAQQALAAAKTLDVWLKAG